MNTITIAPENECACAYGCGSYTANSGLRHAEVHDDRSAGTLGRPRTVRRRFDRTRIPRVELRLMRRNIGVKAKEWRYYGIARFKLRVAGLIKAAEVCHA